VETVVLAVTYNSLFILLLIIWLVSSSSLSPCVDPLKSSSKRAPSTQGLWKKQQRLGKADKGKEEKANDKDKTAAEEAKEESRRRKK